MAYSTTDVDVFRGTSGVSLPKQLSTEILQNAISESAIMRLVRRIPVPGSGLTIPVILGDPEATWIDETHEKHVGEPTFSTKNMVPYKLATIVLFSDEFKRDLPTLHDALMTRLPGAIAKKFDQTVFNGEAPGTGFDVLTSSPTQDIETDAWAGLVAAKQAVAAKGGRLNGWALDAVGEGVLLSAVDGNDRPLFLDSVREGGVSSILGAPVYIAQAAGDSTNDVLGVAGDWTKAAWGMVEDIKIKISEEATINDGTNQINLWQRNMFAVMVEAELGFVCVDDDYFIHLTEASNLS